MTEAEKSGLAQLEDVLDRFGGDRTRWPAAVRREISALISVSEEASRRLAEAEAFDRLLDLAPPVDAHRVTALADKIMISAKSQPRVIAIEPISRSKDEPRTRLRRHAGGIAALAASLVLGLLAGQSSSVQPVATAFSELVGASDGAAWQDAAGDPDAIAAVSVDSNGDGELL